MVPRRLRWRKGVHSLEAKHQLMDLRIISLTFALVGLAALSWVAYDPLVRPPVSALPSTRPAPYLCT